MTLNKTAGQHADASPGQLAHVGASAGQRVGVGGRAPARPRVRVHRWQRTISQTAVFGALSLFLLAGLATARSGPGSIALIILAAIAAVLAVRASRAGIVFDDAGIVVRDAFHTHRLRWSEVTELVPGSDDFGHRTAAVLTTDERRIRLFALNGIGFWDSNSEAYHRISGRVGELIDQAKADGRIPAAS